MLKTEAIQRFLQTYTLKDLANLYNSGQEVQIIVAQDGGMRIDGEYKGKHWHGFTDNFTTWRPIRIPYFANDSEKCNYTDSEISFDLVKHAEGVGLTGWNFVKKQSIWVAFDFDAISGHKERHTKKLTEIELKEIVEKVSNIPWVTVRKSTSGKGIHFYVFLKETKTNDHTEHAALARAILGKLSALTSYDFGTKVDNCGGNMWIWHRKMLNTDGLTLIKQGIPLLDIPDFSQHIKVITGHKKRAVPLQINESQEMTFEQLIGQQTFIQLDEEHKKLMEYLEEKNYNWWYDQERHLLVTHTHYLKLAHTDLNLKGIFKTLATGSEINDHNCFMSPLRQGAWSVRRFTPGVEEDISWCQDGLGYTYCSFNKIPDLGSASRSFEGVENTKGGFVFSHAEKAVKAIEQLGVKIPLPSWAGGKSTIISEHKDGRLLIELEHDSRDKIDDMSGWLLEKNKWKRLFAVPKESNSEPLIGNYDDLVRHLITVEGDDAGWVIKSNEIWQTEPLGHLKIALKSLNFKGTEIDNILGSSIFKCWTLVNLPFQPEYPGNRTWNDNAAQLKILPKEGEYKHWQKILIHCGACLTNNVLKDSWCIKNNILSGGDYLKIWIASLFQYPEEPLPYLFFYGEQNSGKSIFHEALELLMTHGCVRAHSALENPTGFNAELLNAIVCVVEETDLKKNKTAYNRIKDWVTARYIQIHPKGSTPFNIRNCTHWIQASNSLESCPIFQGDTRITMCQVLPLLDLIPKKKLIQELINESSAFLFEILKVEIPEPIDRLNIPTLLTDDKHQAEKSNMNSLELFLDEKCFIANGNYIKLQDLYDRFLEWLDPMECNKWNKIRMSRELPSKFPKGRITDEYCVGNISFEKINTNGNKPLILKGDLLIS